MRTARTLLVSVAVLFLVMPAIAQKSNLKYDSGSEATVKGTVQEVREVPGSCMGETGLHLILTTDAGSLEVQVAPVEFLKVMEVTFAKGEKLDIVGSKVTLDGNPLVLAREINQNGNQVVVRDKKGEPVWTWMKKG